MTGNLDLYAQWANRHSITVDQASLGGVVELQNFPEWAGAGTEVAFDFAWSESDGTLEKILVRYNEGGKEKTIELTEQIDHSPISTNNPGKANFQMPDADVTLYAVGTWNSGVVSDITIKPAEHGRVTAVVDGSVVTQAEYLKRVDLRVGAYVGYGLDTLTVMQGDTPVVVSKYDDVIFGTYYYFRMPAGPVTVTATFKENQPVTEMTWSDLQTALNNGGTITLTNDVTAGENDTTLTVPNDTEVTLDLNGHTISRGLTERTRENGIFAVNGTLTVTDSSVNADNPSGLGQITGDFGNIWSNGAITVAGKLTLEGGRVTGNTGKSSVQVMDGGEFSMTGGAICDNVMYNVGGVLIEGGGTFSMSGGSVTGNEASSGVGGVNVNGGTFNMTDGSITGNAAEWGGGVDLM